MPYLHCPHCRRTAWLHADGGAGLRCHRCDAELTPMPERQARFLVSAVRERFARDAALESSRRRFARD